MNSVKNLLVCVMLMGVSYGAYQVISSPDPTMQDDSALAETLDIQVGRRTDDATMLGPAPNDSLTNHEPAPSSKSPLSIPPLPDKFADTDKFADKMDSTQTIQPPPLKSPDLKMPELSIERSPSTGSGFVGNNPDAAPTHPQVNRTPGSDSFAPPLNPGTLKRTDDPIAFQPPKFAPSPPLANKQQGTITSSGGGSFDPTPETQLAPITPKPSLEDVAGNIRDQVDPPSSDQFLDSAKDFIDSNRQNIEQTVSESIEGIKDQFAQNIVEPSRAAEKMLAPEQIGIRAKELIDTAREKSGEAIDALAEKADEFIPTLPNANDSRAKASEKTYATIDWNGLNEMANSGQPRKALEQLSQSYNARLPQDRHMQMLEWLDLLAGKVIYSTEHLLEDRPHVVRDGETLEDISQAWNVPAQLIYNVNQSKIGDPSMLIPGTELKVISGPFNAVVSLERQELTLFLHGMYAGRFPIELGQDGPGISHGSFIVEEKSPGHEYVGADGQTIAAATANNPYGQFWIGLNENLSIHESNPTPGQQDNRGMIRLGSRDAADVFGILSSGSNVIIRR